MLHALALPLILLAFTTQTLAKPAQLPAGNSDQVNQPDYQISPDVASPSSKPNLTDPVTRSPIRRTPLTLYLQLLPPTAPLIPRTPLIHALYESRAQILALITQHGANATFSSTFTNSTIIPPSSSSTTPSQSSLVLTIAPNPGAVALGGKGMTYQYLMDTLQGLMDATFYPFRAEIEGYSFAVEHRTEGFLGVGSLGVRSGGEGEAGDAVRDVAAGQAGAGDAGLERPVTVPELPVAAAEAAADRGSGDVSQA